MLEALRGLATAALLAAATVYFLAWRFGESRRLAHIYSLGFSDPVLSYWSAFLMQIDSKRYIQKQWERVPPGTKWVKLPGFIRWYVLPFGTEEFQALTRASDDIVSSTEAVNEYLHARHTLRNDIIGDGIQVPLINTELTRSLGELVPEVNEEALAALDEMFPLQGNEWKSFLVSPALLQIFAKVANRVLVGLPLCRDASYIKTNVDFAVNVIVMSFVLCATPPPLRDLVDRLVSPIPKKFERIRGYLQPIIDARRAEKEKLGAEYEPHPDMLSWLIDLAEQHGRDDRDIILRMMSTNFGVIHTASMNFQHAFYSLLSMPQYMEELRAEVVQCIDEHGWSKTAVDNMKLMDGFIKESQRLNIIGIIIGNRIATKDCTLAGVFIPKGTMLTANVVEAHNSRDFWGSTVDEFDPYRYIRMEKETGKKLGIVTTSANSLSFGLGRHSCPGRFFAAQELKLLMAHLLLDYEMKFDKKEQSRPKDVWFGMSCMPNPNTRVLLRKRVKA
ncbi:cytochrome P450 [Ephemerocybe angulata]|uniref:Cytochrome P450 n=1 Tax=Ephemerocybe angulata TaxID=980116 RepID=A0A8H6LYW6_9AGAR|nr:cytochrome P450 [Tulosesus angulatus]